MSSKHRCRVQPVRAPPRIPSVHRRRYARQPAVRTEGVPDWRRSLQRGPEFDPKIDSILSSPEAARQRTKLDKYCSGKGQNAAFSSAIPGGYALALEMAKDGATTAKPLKLAVLPFVDTWRRSSAMRALAPSCDTFTSGRSTWTRPWSGMNLCPVPARWIGLKTGFQGVLGVLRVKHSNGGLTDWKCR